MSGTYWVIELGSDYPTFWTGEAPDIFSRLDSQAVRFARQEDAVRVLANIIKPPPGPVRVCEHIDGESLQ